ncbi:helix-turn-helix transcriptional regulator [Pseudomonas nitroreducens]|uniref:helix-turn-helix transcriptional regulator n=1 Tax=Pseudomonas nitroreducens TaxID=46680 RepID=UPI001642B1C0|nr:helix-turn-helix transcriptional regulator [Pseudomonas nitroreducens]
MEIFISIGERLKEVRVAMGMSQSDFAEIAADAGVPGATRQSQANYEKGRQMPSAAYLAAIAAEGADVLYVVTGRHSNVASTQHLTETANPVTQLPADELLLLEAYRALGAVKRKELLASLLTGGAGKKSAKSSGVTVSGSNNRTAGRDYHEKE